MTVTANDTGALVWEPPGPGAWRLDKVHIPRPATRAFQDVIGALCIGFGHSAERYGWLLGTFQMEFVNGFMYAQPAPVDPDVFGERIATAEAAFANRLWRADADRWELEVKPAALAAHRELIDVDPTALDDRALAAHLRDAFDHYWAMWVQHHDFNGSHMVPVGDFVVSTELWTGMPRTKIAQLLSGASPVSRGASPQLAALVAVLRDTPAALALLDDRDNPAGSVIGELRDLDASSDLLDEWLTVVGYRLVDGFDVCCPYALEQPAFLVAALRHAIAEDPAGPVRHLDALLATVRDAVPEEHRAEFDQVYEDARYCFHMRDERGIYSDATAAGLMRRAMLAAGARLVENGALTDADLAIDASVDELDAMLGGAGDAPSEDELSQRAAHRGALTVRDAPDVLGEADGGPPPLDLLPPAAGRMMRALIAGSDPPPPSPAESRPANQLQGVGASPGVYRGTARVLHSPDEFHRLQDGDVLVTLATGEAFNVAIAAVSALVTDQGGVMSHAGITAREYAIPAVLGTVDATHRISDGATVVVDGDNGTVTWE